MHPFHCGRCRQPVYFENLRCESCGAELGFVPDERRMVAFEPVAGDPAAADGGAGLGVGEDQGRPFQACANRHPHAVCNWMLGADDEGSLCRSCVLTEVIPDLSVDGHLDHWRAIERAKRRLVYTLQGLGLEPKPKRDADDTDGLAFRLLASTDEERVLTGHAEGVITLNIAEADDVHRERARVAMGEPVRTLLGHLRHEVSHWLQYRWIDNTPDAEACREVFGDERADYAAALKRHHEDGARADWPQSFISAYASAHPWEDWAETCAHFLLVVDAVQTAAAWGLTLDGPAAAARPEEPDAFAAPVEALVLAHWLPVARFVNAMNRSLGVPDSYPFLIADPVLHKMATVQRLLAQAAQRRARGESRAVAAEPSSPDAETPSVAEPQAIAA